MSTFHLCFLATMLGLSLAAIGTVCIERSNLEWNLLVWLVELAFGSLTFYLTLLAYSVDHPNYASTHVRLIVLEATCALLSLVITHFLAELMRTALTTPSWKTNQRYARA